MGDGAIPPGSGGAGERPGKVVQVNLTGGYRLEYGGALGGVLNVLTRSGSNDLHAGLFGYYRNDPSDRFLPPRNETSNRVSLPARVGSPSVWS
jgi:hypothetical protein